MKRTPAKPVKLSEEQILEVEHSVFSLVEKHLEAKFYLLSVNLEKEAGFWYLRIYVENTETPISLNECEAVSRAIDPLLDEMQILQNFPYSLEVSSPGLFRPLIRAREFEFYRGYPVRIEARPPAKNAKTPAKPAIKPQEGILQAFDAHAKTVTLQRNNSDESFQIQLGEDLVAYLNPKIRFPDEVEAGSELS